MHLNIRHHTSADYSALPDIDAAGIGVLQDNDRSCLEELGLHLVQSKANTRFGVTLLHSHFSVSDDEVFIETSSQSARTIHTRPVGRDALNENNCVAVMARFASTASPDLAMIGLEYLVQGDPIFIKTFNSDDEQVLHSLQSILRKHGKVDRFGLRIIHDPVTLAPHEILLERIDGDRRTLTCEVAKCDDPLARQSIETFWLWETAYSDSGERLVNTVCPAKCKVKCVQYPTGHNPAGHDTGGHKGGSDFAGGQ